LPYGDGLTTIPVSSTDTADATEHHFTGKERDTESGNDYFEARYYSSAMGRFMSPDWSAKEEPVPCATMDDPQSLNLYSYVRNNPLIRVDADGHCCDTDDVVNFLGGALNAFGSDNLLGFGRQDQTTVAGRTGAAVGDFAAAVGGAAVATVSAGADVVGVALDSTGAGAIAGVPINVVATAGVVVGSAAATEGFTHLAASASGSKETGSYTNTHESGKTYDGKGDKERSQDSGKRVEQATGDKHVSTDWKPSANDREAFKDESRRLDSHGGHGSSSNYNQRESPGKKYRKQDGSQ
jgi:RHS repeat-associated protein